MSTCGQMVTQLPHPAPTPQSTGPGKGTGLYQASQGSAGTGGGGPRLCPASVASLTVPSAPSSPPPAPLVLVDFIMVGDSLFLGLLSSHLVFCPPQLLMASS